MTDDAEMIRFTKVAYDESDKLFGEDETEILISRGEDGRSLPNVLIRHLSSGIELEVSEFPTQTMNAIIARIRLAQRIRSAT
jgi:hypothetical protein